MFKVGDKVVCVESYTDELVLGEEYTLNRVSRDGVYASPWIMGYMYGSERFVLASEYSAAENIKEQTALDIQHGGKHYKGMKIQPVEFIHANNIGYMEGNCIKYLCRWQMKNGLEDLSKAKHYIELLIEMENKRNESKD